MMTQRRRIFIIFAVAAALVGAALVIVGVIVPLRLLLAELAGSEANPVCDRSLRTHLTIGGRERVRSPVMSPSGARQVVVFHSSSLQAIETEIIPSSAEISCATGGTATVRKCEWRPAGAFAIRLLNISPESATVTVEAIIDRCNNDDSGQGAWVKDPS